MDVPGILALSIPIVAIIVFGVVVIARLLITHRERMTMIEMGMHPDYPPLDADSPAPYGAADTGGEQTERPATERLQ
jgi:hypothetical protein